MDQKKVIIYTDGACKGNPGHGGWGALLRYGSVEKELWGGEANTTNNRMELMAAIKALKALKRACHIKLYSDSRYVIDGITKSLPIWKSKNWRKNTKSPVKNQDLWIQLEKLTLSHHIEWHWVKGHSGNPGNEAADALANRGVRELKNSIRKAG